MWGLVMTRSRPSPPASSSSVEAERLGPAAEQRADGDAPDGMGHRAAAAQRPVSTSVELAVRRRYSTLIALGLGVPEDDDAVAAGVDLAWPRRRADIGLTVA